MFTRFIKRSLLIVPIGLIAASVTACFKDDETLAEKFEEWRTENQQYVTDAEALTNPDGSLYYTRIVPSWAPDAFSLVHWHNDRSLTEKNLSPMDNSTVQIKYELYDINGNEISNSYYGTDSLYTSKPQDNIVGVWAPLTQMHVGDSVTVVIPTTAGYGAKIYGEIKPYSTLVYNIKLVGIPAYEVE